MRHSQWINVLAAVLFLTAVNMAAVYQVSAQPPATLTVGVFAWLIGVLVGTLRRAARLIALERERGDDPLIRELRIAVSLLPIAGFVPVIGIVGPVLIR